MNAAARIPLGLGLATVVAASLSACASTSPFAADRPDVAALGEPSEELASSEEPAGDRTGRRGWGPEFSVVEIPSPHDGEVQRAYMRKATQPGRPLAIVLHTWSGDYAQYASSLAEEAQALDWNYIHPDVRGPNRTPDACCSDASRADFDAAVLYALGATGADAGRVHVVGSSGGGYAALCFLTSTRIPVRSYSAWVPITDLEAWHDESLTRTTRYAADVRACTASGETSAELDRDEARARSPLYREVAPEKLAGGPLATTIRLYAGIRDGHDGSVPISHSLRFYDKLARQAGQEEIGEEMIARLTERAEVPQAERAGGMLGERAVLFHRHFLAPGGEVSVTLFDGAHEMLSGVALRLLPTE
jgi:pimeloyl-ACP methyl ester carboxylesterase